MDLTEFSFFNPSPNFREMSILKALAENPEISQERLARTAGVVPSMINRYIKDFEDQDLISKEGENRRRMKYILSESGRFRLQYLTIAYLREVAKLYSQSRDIFGNVLDMITVNGYNNLLLYGAGIIGEILADTLRTEGINLLGFVDDSPAKQEDILHGFKVYSPEKGTTLGADGVIVGSFRHAENIVKQAIKYGFKNIMVFDIAESGKVSIRTVGEDD